VSPGGIDGTRGCALGMQVVVNETGQQGSAVQIDRGSAFVTLHELVTAHGDDVAPFHRHSRRDGESIIDRDHLAMDEQQIGGLGGETRYTGHAPKSCPRCPTADHFFNSPLS
jgi:hypothetical protein